MEPHNKREERLLTAAHAEPAHWYAGRGGRRRLVSAGVFLLVLLWANAGVSWVLAPSNTAMITCFVILGIVLLGAIVLWPKLMVSSRGAVGLPDHLLDERQRADRLRAHAIAHRLTLLLLFVSSFAVLTILPEGDSPELPAAAITLFLLALLFTVWALPTLVAAWRLPEPPPEDEDG